MCFSVFLYKINPQETLSWSIFRIIFLKIVINIEIVYRRLKKIFYKLFNIVVLKIRIKKWGKKFP